MVYSFLAMRLIYRRLHHIIVHGMCSIELTTPTRGICTEIQLDSIAQSSIGLIWSAMNAAWPSSVVPIYSNFYCGRTPAPVFPELDLYTCKCKRRMCLDENGSSCANFHSQVLCDDSNCTSGLGCGNRLIRTHHFDVIPTNTGLGLAASTTLTKGEFVVEYVGELIFEITKRERPHGYIMALKTPTCFNQKVYIDARKCGNESRFINHSCKPNCEWHEFQSSSGPRVGVFTRCEIDVGEEITVEYTRKKLGFKCLCGERKCRDRVA